MTQKSHQGVQNQIELGFINLSFSLIYTIWKVIQKSQFWWFTFLFVSSYLISARKVPLDCHIDGVLRSSPLEVGCNVLNQDLACLTYTASSSITYYEIWHTYIRIQIHLEIFIFIFSSRALLCALFSCIFMYKVCINKSKHSHGWRMTAV